VNLKTALAALVISMLLASLAVGVHSVKADSSDAISFPGGVTIYSPVNETYDSNFLTLNVGFGWGAGLNCSLSYSIDGSYEAPIPLMLNNSNSSPPHFEMISLATGTVQLPELSEGSHRLTVYEKAYLGDYYGANPPGAPFEPTSPGSADYVASWVDTVDFSISSIAVAQTPTPQPTASSAPTITNLSIENKTYVTTDIPLIFIVNENTSKFAYSLDGKGNTTIAGNATLTGLPIGEHNITIYAWNDAGSIGASQTVNFAVATAASGASQSPEPSPTALVIASIAAVAVFIGGCLVCFKKKG
jgi:hypothetical protein